MISQNVCTYWCCMQRQKHILLSLCTLKWWQEINLWHRDAPKDISRVQSTAASSISKPNCCSQVVLIGSTQKSLIYQSVSSAIHRLTPWCRFFQRRETSFRRVPGEVIWEVRKPTEQGEHYHAEVPSNHFFIFFTMISSICSGLRSGVWGAWYSVVLTAVSWGSPKLGKKSDLFNKNRCAKTINQKQGWKEGRLC